MGLVGDRGDQRHDVADLGYGTAQFLHEARSVLGLGHGDLHKVGRAVDLPADFDDGGPNLFGSGRNHADIRGSLNRCGRDARRLYRSLRGGRRHLLDHGLQSGRRG